MPQEPTADEPLLPCLEIEPQHDTADAAVIWLHGLGADGHDFEPIVPEFRLPEESRIRFVFPHAPPIAVTLNWGMVMPAWYDVVSLEPGAKQDEEGIRLSGRRMEALIQRERDRGIAPERIVAAGFSQGAAISLHQGLRYPEKLAGILVLSSWLPLAHTLEEERSDANRDTPILMCHGTLDPMVAEARGRKAHDQLRELGYDVTYHTYPMQHQVCMEEVQLVGEWLRERLPPAP